MENVIELSPGVDANVLKTVATALRSLWLMRAIETDAYYLGMNVLARMQAEGRYVVNLTMEEIEGEAVTLNGKAFAGPFAGDIRVFISSLQQLHGHAWMHSDMRIGDLERSDVHERHFTRVPKLVVGADFTPGTPVWFKLQPSNLADVSAHMDEMLVHYGEFITKTRNLEVD